MPHNEFNIPIYAKHTEHKISTYTTNTLTNCRTLTAARKRPHANGRMRTNYCTTAAAHLLPGNPR